MKKEKVFTVLFGIGFFGVMMHPAMLVFLLVGIIGMNYYGLDSKDPLDQI